MIVTIAHIKKLSLQISALEEKVESIQKSISTNKIQEEPVHKSAEGSDEFICDYQQKTCINALPEDFRYNENTNTTQRSCVHSDGRRKEC
jgi:hypothetical protein